VNSVDYLLKPINKKSLSKALDKLNVFSFKDNNADLAEKIASSIRKSKSSHKKHFLIPYKDKLIPLALKKLHSSIPNTKWQESYVFDKQTYTMDASLDELHKQLNPSLFFRANRQYIVSHRAITDLTVWFGGRLSVNLSVETPERIIVSRARSSDFKKWYTGNSDLQ
jgi:two-component system response regulator LytT